MFLLLHTLSTLGKFNACKSCLYLAHITYHGIERKFLTLRIYKLVHASRIRILPRQRMACRWQTILDIFVEVDQGALRTRFLACCSECGFEFLLRVLATVLGWRCLQVFRGLAIFILSEIYEVVLSTCRLLFYFNDRDCRGVRFLVVLWGYSILLVCFLARKNGCYCEDLFCLFFRCASIAVSY